MAKKTWLDDYVEQQIRIAENPKKFIEDFKIISPFWKGFVYFEHFLIKLTEKPIKKILDMVDVIEKSFNKPKAAENNKKHEENSEIIQQIDELFNDVTKHKKKPKAQRDIRKFLKAPQENELINEINYILKNKPKSKTPIRKFVRTRHKFKSTEIKLRNKE